MKLAFHQGYVLRFVLFRADVLMPEQSCHAATISEDAAQDVAHGTSVAQGED
jgi:hypothetical protein